MAKVDYGIDAPGVVRILIVVGAILIVLCIVFPVLRIGEVIVNTSGFIWAGISLCITGLLMLAYSKFGKFKHRDRMLKMRDWIGSEQVLDVGCGLGLLLIGAAKKLNSGKAIGLEIFSGRDLSNNTIDQLRQNAEVEQVSDHIEIVEESIVKTTFPDHTFDVILSNLCLHNISKAADREKACAEIYRILKPSGHLILSDFKNNRSYASIFKSLGMQIQKHGPYIFSTFPPLTILTGTTPGIV